jgi:pimeloyl-ACP methyl ester carboxylesterase
MDVRFVFIGGLGDGPGLFHSRIVARVAEGTIAHPPSFGWEGIAVSQESRYLEWTDGAFGRSKALRVVSQLSQRHPELPLVIVGHSYGADAAWRVVRRISRTVSHLVTIDGVSWQTKFLGNRKPTNVSQWTNVYVTGVKDRSDVIALVGGQWQQRSAADLNINASLVTRSEGAITHRSFAAMWQLAIPHVQESLQVPLSLLVR